ncbi:MAG: hypothetical protein HYY78_03530 [Betaproteobacteria bacterium]|nr:hypothetical protein [Betaproteobacteria bacterium]
MAKDENRTKVTILTSSYRIRGYIDVLPGARVTDFVVQAKDFIAVTDAEVYEPELGGRQVLTAPFIDVNRDHIQVLAPAS